MSVRRFRKLTKNPTKPHKHNNPKGDKMKILVLSGGLSPERDVSLVSGALIANALRRRGHAVALLDLYLGGTPDFTSVESSVPTIGHTEPDLNALIASNNNRTSPVAEGIVDAAKSADVTFLALHGGIGENGVLRAMLDCEGVRCTGSPYVGSMLAMDKDLTKRMLKLDGIPTAPWVKTSPDVESVARIEAEVGYPCVVKPIDGGSSVGVQFASDRAQLVAALNAAKSDATSHLIVEKLIRGREFSCGVLLGKALPSIEIIPKEGFYDYKNKYTAGMTTEITPADITPAQEKRIGELALAAHSSVGLGSYSRTDFMLDDESGEFICLEVNTLPGMTPTSLLPQEAQAVGIEYDELCEMIALDALN